VVKKDICISELDFMSTIITEDKYSVSKMSSASPEAASLEGFRWSTLHIGKSTFSPKKQF